MDSKNIHIKAMISHIIMLFSFCFFSQRIEKKQEIKQQVLFLLSPFGVR